MKSFEGILFCYKIYFTFILLSIHIFIQKAPRRSEDTQKNRTAAPVNQQVEKKQHASGSGIAFTSGFHQPATSTIQHPKIDATDRRHIEAQNDDKSHSTKETLDDIKLIHYKEKKKKEQNISESYQPRIHLIGSVS